MVIKTECESPVREPANETASEKSLKIQNQIKTFRPELVKHSHQSHPGVERPPPFPIKGDEGVDIRIVFEERHQSPVDPPVNLSPGVVQPDHAQDRKRMNDIPEGARFEDEDFQLFL